MAGVRLTVWAVCFVAAFFTTGPIFGWPALQLMLHNEGIYADTCGEWAENLDCPERAMKMNVVFSAGFFTSFAGRILWGLLLDSQGPRFTSALGCLTVALGASLMAVAGRDLDLFPLAAALIGIGGPAVHCSNFHVSNLFPERKRMVITGFSGIFGTSGLVFVLLRVLYTGGLSFRWVFFVYTAVLAVMAVAVFSVQSPVVFKSGQEVTRVLSWRREAEELGPARPAPVAAPAGGSSQPSFWATIRKQMASAKAVGITVFFSIHCLHLQFYLGNAKDILAGRGDDGTYAVVFNVVGSSGLVWAPLVGGFLDHVSFDVAFGVCVLFGVLCNLCSHLPGLGTQVPTFLFWTLNRLLLFAGYFSFLPASFGFQTFGTISGVTSTIAAAVGLVCIPLSALAARHEAYGEVLWSCLAAMLASLFFPLLLRRQRLAARVAAAAASAGAEEKLAGGAAASAGAEPGQAEVATASQVSVEVNEGASESGEGGQQVFETGRQRSEPRLWRFLCCGLSATPV